MSVTPLSAPKRELRARLLAARSVRDPTARREAGQRLVESVLQLVERAPTATVAAYVSLSDEPDTGPTIEALVRQGATVLLPVLCDDMDLDWAELTGAELTGAELRPGRLGPLEPTGPLLGLAAIQSAGLVLCPGLAANRQGHRLGRGGGSYDRALVRTGTATLRAVALYDDEIIDAIPAEPHDQPVDVLVTPAGLTWVSPRRL